MPLRYEEFETHKSDYLQKVADQLKKEPRYAVSVDNAGFLSNVADDVLKFINVNVPRDGRAAIRILDNLRRIDQGRMHWWKGISPEDVKDMEAFLAEATPESAAKEMYRKDCVESQRAEEKAV